MATVVIQFWEGINPFTPRLLDAPEQYVGGDLVSTPGSLVIETVHSTCVSGYKGVCQLSRPNVTHAVAPNRHTLFIAHYRPISPARV